MGILRRDHAITIAALIVAAIAVIAIALVWGPGAVLRAFSHPHWPWLALAGGATLLAPLAYMMPYRIIDRLEGGRGLSEGRVAQVVLTGFAPFLARGGFGLDHKVLRQAHGDGRRAAVRVLGLGALEWALLAPAAWLAAVVLLLDGDPRPMTSLLWPWAILVPIGFAVGLGIAWIGHRRGWTEFGAGAREKRARALRGIGVLRTLIGMGAAGAGAWLGMALYWGLDVAGFFGAVHFLGLPCNVGEVVIAYATGYALTRRTMPLGGAGVTEVLMTFALHWAGQPVPAALAAVVVYRVFNLLMPTAPALVIKPRVESLVDDSPQAASRPAAT